jgi:hypothetical protein
MKKLIISTAFVLFAIVSSQAQVLISLLLGDRLNTGKIEFGLDGGLTLSNMDGVGSTANRRGFNLGFYFDIKTKNPAWMLTTGVMVKSPMGAKGLPLYSLNDPTLDEAFKEGSVNARLSYFHVPIMMKYMTRSHLFVKGGVQLGLRHKAIDQFVSTMANDNGELTLERDRKDDYHPLDAGLAAGIGYRLMKGYGMNLGINYYYGLVDVLVDDNSPGVHNRAWYINIGIPIGKGAAEKKKQHQ